MSLFVKDPTSDKKIAITLKAEEKRHSELPLLSQFLKDLTKTELAFNATDFALKVAAAAAAEGVKIHDGSILEASYEKLKKHNIRYLEGVNGLIDFGMYPSSLRLNFGMTIGSETIPDQGTHAEILGLSELVDSGNLAIIALSLTPPVDFNAADNAAFRLDRSEERRVG